MHRPVLDSRSHRHVAWLVLVAACSSLPRRAGDADVPLAECALAPPVVTAVVGGAAAMALGLPRSLRGVAAQRRDDGFEVAFVRDPGGHWQAVGGLTVSLSVDAADAELLVAVRGEATDPPPTAANEVLRLGIAAGPAGTIVRAALPGLAGARVADAVRRALRMAVSIETHTAGLSEPNLAALRCTQLLHLARTHGAGSAQRAGLLRRAMRLPGAPAEVFAALGREAQASGDAGFATASLQRAALLCRDPAARAELARQAAELDCRSDDRAGDLRRAAAVRLGRGDLGSASALLHQASRLGADPRQDFALLQDLHERSGEGSAAVAARLLAREFELGTTTAGLALQDPGARPDGRPGPRLRRRSVELDVPAMPPR